MLEILAPAGNAECANAAIHNGADAIYLGFSSFSARQNAGNFDEAALRAVIEKAHFCDVKVYVAMNTVVKDKEIEPFIETLLLVWKTGADAIILQDAFLGKVLHTLYPEIVLHLSTQAGICTQEGAEFAKECGFSRVILARETPLSEIAKIAKVIETEVFVQGALCTCFSGQCYFSSFAGGNSGNRGRCKQPCRKLYTYNRKGFEEKSYALSLSDLSVGEQIDKLISLGVVSFKIEGRMRRAEYVAAAVRYYRLLIDNDSSESVKARALSDLKRTYNRGNYTQGLAFGQDKRFLSPLVQGHMGEKVGVVKVQNGKYYVESVFSPQQGDAFKILRNGKEVGGAQFAGKSGRSFILYSKDRLKNGDGVFITTDTEVNERVLLADKQGKLSIKLYFTEGEYAVAEWEDVQVKSAERLQKAEARSLTEEEVRTCFSKTDGLPVLIDFKEIQINGSIFIPKSLLNAFRREFYATVSNRVTQKGNREYALKTFPITSIKGENGKIAVIGDDFKGVKADIGIYKPNDYQSPVSEDFKEGTFEKYLYYPPFITEKDAVAISNRLNEAKFDGIYVENYGGIPFARSKNLKIFAGTGLNFTNRVSISEFLKVENVSYYAISKELNVAEAEPLIGEKAFALSFGDIKLMDLCYCPFGKTCSSCDKKQVYILTDENNRAFPVRRYVAGDGSCRFEVYNCAGLIGKGANRSGKLLDLTLVFEKGKAIESVYEEEKQKTLYKNYTSGHWKRGVL